MKIPPQPVPPRPHIQTPHHVSETSAVGSCRISIELEIWNSFEFQVVLLDDDQLIFKKWVKIKMATLQSASDFMKRKYPSPYFFELCKTYKSQ